MNRLIISILVLVLAFPFSLLGQMVPLSDHYEYDALSINPAFAGSNDALSTTISYRDQWVGFEDSPKRQMLSVHSPFDNNRIGLGLLIEKNSTGIFKETSFMGNYAYRIEVKNGILALGLGVGATVYNIAWDDLQASDPNDILLINNPNSAVMPSVSLGAYYSAQKYYIGISIPYILSHEIDQSTGKYKIKNDFPRYNYFLSGGYKISISQQVNLLPSILIKYHPENKIQIDYNAQVSLIDRFWLGIGYRSKDMLVAMLQCQLNYQIRMAYSYDFEIGSLGKYRNGSHEIVLGYIFKYARNVTGPRQY